MPRTRPYALGTRNGIRELRADAVTARRHGKPDVRRAGSLLHTPVAEDIQSSRRLYRQVMQWADIQHRLT